MKKNILRVLSLFLACTIAMMAFPTVVSVAENNISVAYEFIGDNAKRAGFAQGIITVENNNSDFSGYYLVYYTSGNDILTGYDELASIKNSANKVFFEIPDGIMIPEGATGIAVFESDTHFLDNPPNIASAVAKCAIPAEKQLNLGDAEVTFGTASDVHMNYEYYGRSAYSKWSTILDFYAENNASYVIVTGDMTGDASDPTPLLQQYEDYVDLINDSEISIDSVYESIGNHGNTPNDLGMFSEYTEGSDEVHPYDHSPYFYVLKKGVNGAKDNLFVFLWQELSSAGQSAKIDNFSQAQIDWLAGVLDEYDNESTNIFLIAHSPFLNYGAGDRYKGGGYTALTTFSTDFAQNMRLKGLLQYHKDVIVMSGHTHLTLYDGQNYSDVNNEFARTVHVSSTCWPRAYNADATSCPAGTDGRKSAGTDYGSEAYLVSVYADYIVYTGYNMTTGKIIPAACLIMPTKTYDAPTPDESFEGSGTKDDPYLIQNEQDFLLLTSGFNANTSSEVEKMYGYGKYFLQTNDIDLTKIKAYCGTNASGAKNPYDSASNYYKSAFAGTYNGDGYSIKINIDAPDDQRSVFPYLYGTIVNTVIKGKIVADGAVQPIRTSRGNIINCYFDLELSASMTNGGLYTNYNYVYNLYTRGKIISSTNIAPFAASDNASAVVANVYCCYTDASGAVVADDVAITAASPKTVVSAFNDRTSDNYNTAKDLLDGIPLCEAFADGTGIGFTHVYGVKNNLAYGKSFTPHGYYDADGEWPCDYRGNITDGKIHDALTYDNCWFGFNKSASDDGVINANNGIGTVVIDLEDVYTLESVKTHLFIGNQSGIARPSFIRVSASFDGSFYSSTVDIPVPYASDNNIAWAESELAITGRYIKLEYGLTSAFVFVDEVELYGAEYSSSEYIGKRGDLNNNGQIDAVDYLLLKRFCFNTYDINDIPLGDVDNNGKIDSVDYNLLKRICYGTYEN